MYESAIPAESKVSNTVVHILIIRFVEYLEISLVAIMFRDIGLLPLETLDTSLAMSLPRLHLTTRSVGTLGNEYLCRLIMYEQLKNSACRKDRYRNISK